MYKHVAFLMNLSLWDYAGAKSQLFQVIKTHSTFLESRQVLNHVFWPHSTFSNDNRHLQIAFVTQR